MNTFSMLEISLLRIVSGFEKKFEDGRHLALKQISDPGGKLTFWK